MNRKGLREQVFKLLFQAQFNEPDEMDELADNYFSAGDLTVTPKDQKYILDRCHAVMDCTEQLDEELRAKLKDWKLERIGKVELAVLRLAVYEIEHDPRVPAGVAINEAVELAKKYGQENAGAFVNGVLSCFAPEEKESEASGTHEKQ